MNVNITITHTLATEVIDILKNFSRGVDPLQPVQTPAVVNAPKEKTKKLTAVTSAAAEEPENNAAPQPEVEMSMETLRAKTAEVIQSGKRTEVSKLLTEFGVGKLVELPKDQFGAFYKKVVAL